jgi:sugar phosphate isomerase/epimerase
MKRRQFLQAGAAFAGASLLSNDLFAAKKRKKNLSLQLYSVRTEMSKDPAGTIKKLGEIGYKDCEHAGYGKGKFYGYSPADFKKLLADNGMTMKSGHTVLGKQHWDESKNDFTDEWKQTVTDAATVGQKYIISPWLDVSLRKDFDSLKRFMDIFNKCGELCQKSGIKYGYHNHDFEFSLKLTSKRIYDLILENTDPKLVVHQLDIGNMYGGGGRALELLAQYPGRFELMHVKDEITTEKGGHESAILGTGIIGVKDVIDLGVKSGGTNYFIIEQESYQGKAPIDCMKENFDIMKKWGY